ncbi:MAG: hypothetical protein JWQ40_2150 [Segetibacter sp.]|nr:hypothetical protein [Segetibacter sp.]
MMHRENMVQGSDTTMYNTGIEACNKGNLHNN